MSGYLSFQMAEKELDKAIGSVGQEQCEIRDVWQYNMEQEFHVIRKIIQKYRYVAMDSEFPGTVARPLGTFNSYAEFSYQELRCNVQLLKVIQIGFTFMDEQGNTPSPSTWQFNFKFSLNTDMYAQDSIDMLKKAGIQFEKHEEDGIDHDDFAELLTSSGIVLLEEINWICFHPGYDFGYLLKVLSGQNLPIEEQEFMEMVGVYFPNIYDCKHILHTVSCFKGGLQEIALQMQISRVGQQHQAGSDSLLTGRLFFKIQESMFKGKIDPQLCGKIYGLCN